MKDKSPRFESDGEHRVNHPFYENAQNVSRDHTIAASVNALSAGPITVDDGVTVTIEDGAVWTVV